jgi:hypothetical protein
MLLEHTKLRGLTLRSADSESLLSDMKRLFILAHDTARQRALEAVTAAPEGYWVTISEPIKSREQEQAYHAKIADIAEWFQINGKRLDAETLKRLLVDQFKHETRDDPELQRYWAAMAEIEMRPSLDGQRVIVLGTQTRRFPKVLASAFIEWLNAWAAQNEPEQKNRSYLYAQ